MKNSVVLDSRTAGSNRGTPIWLITFADAMSLLLTFFVLLVSFCDLNVKRVIDHDASQAVVRKKAPGVGIEQVKITSKKEDFRGKTGDQIRGRYQYGGNGVDSGHPGASAQILDGEVLSEEEVEEIFYESIGKLNQVAKVQVEKSGNVFNIFFDLKNIFVKDSVYIEEDSEDILFKLAKVIADLHNDIVVESYYTPPEEKEEEEIMLYINRIEYIADFLLRKGGIISERVGISESSAYSDLYHRFTKRQKESYSGIRIILVEKTEGYRQFLEKVKERVRGDKSHG